MRYQKGFTFIEMIVVLALMAMVAGTLLPTGSRLIDLEREQETIKNMDAIAKAVYYYYRDVGQWPPIGGTTPQQRNLRYLFDRTLGPSIPGWRGPYIATNYISTDAEDNTVLYDKWRMPYRAIPDTDNPDIILKIQSAGPDKAYHASMQGDDIVKQAYVGDLAIKKRNVDLTESMDKLARAIRDYNRDTNQWPPVTGVTPPERNLLYLYQNPGVAGWNGPYISSERLPKTPEENTVLYDIWRNRYRAIFISNNQLKIQSAGPDRIHQTPATQMNPQGDDQIKIVYVSDIKRDVTLAEIDAINAALNYYRNAGYTPAIPTSWQTALRYMQNQSPPLLPGTNGTGEYYTDAWGTAYIFDTTSSVPKVKSNNLD